MILIFTIGVLDYGGGMSILVLSYYTKIGEIIVLDFLPNLENIVYPTSQINLLKSQLGNSYNSLDQILIKGLK